VPEAEEAQALRPQRIAVCATDNSQSGVGALDFMLSASCHDSQLREGTCRGRQSQLHRRFGERRDSVNCH
jgi:hypothetical protein